MILVVSHAKQLGCMKHNCVLIKMLLWIVQVLKNSVVWGITWFLEIAFVHDVGMSVCMCVHPEGINYIQVILNLYNQLNKFVVFRNVTKLSIHGHGFCNEAHHDRDQSNNYGYLSAIKVVSFSFTEMVVLMPVHK